MTGYKRVNYYELCRLCTSSQPKEKIHIFRDEGRKMQLQQKIQTCFPLLVCEHDYLPKVVCTTCIETLNQCYTFRQNCINSETMLSSYFSNFRFTDDFKKAGKVYVKDTGQKLENSNHNTVKKVQDVQIENNQQYFTLELPNVTKLQIPTNNNNTPSIVNKQKINESLNIKTNDINSLNVFNSKINESTDKNIQSIFIDVEQLIESGLAETEINKLKEVFLKSPPTKTTTSFKCEICDKAFKRREHLYQHSKLHSGLRPFTCIHCPKTFSRKEHLMRHLTSHSGVKDYSCDVCDKKFSRPDNLKKHKKTHQKTGPFVCDICQKSFVIKHYYLAHKLQHQTGAVLNILKTEGDL